MKFNTLTDDLISLTCIGRYRCFFPCIVNPIINV